MWTSLPKTGIEPMNNIKDILKAIQDFLPPIHKEGHIFIFIFAAATLIIGEIYEPLGWVGLAMTAWCAAFFRDPERVIPVGEDFIVSPADGLIQKIEQVTLPLELGIGSEKVWRISIFLNVFNVHINRVPVAGEITQNNYHPGKFISASLDKASEKNERRSIVVKTKDDQTVVFVQIAGLIARRIVCYIEEGQQVKTGERYGLIRFGSRADVYLPEGVVPQVVEGQTAIGGETILADLSSNASSPREGEVR